MYCSTRRRKDIYDEDPPINPDETLTIPSNAAPDTRYKQALRGYTGFVPKVDRKTDDDSEDTIPPKNRIMIRGYSGYLNKTLDVCGVPLIPSLEKQEEKLQQEQHDEEQDNDEDNENKSNSPTPSGMAGGTAHRSSGHLQDKVEQSTLGSSFTNFRTYGKHMELEERYYHAIQKLFKRGQTQQMLLRMVQCKLSENVSTFAQQYCRSRKIFEYFDLDGSGTLDEHEFRQFLELQNCYFDDIQSLALFAYFDSSKTGGITWEQFEIHAIISNPQGGTGVIPKAITANNKSNDWKSVSRIAERQRKK